MRVLLVEDDTSTAKTIEMMLKSEGYICDCTDLGEDGLEIGKIYDYDLIILDLMLPDMDGYEVLRRLRSSKVKTPILILSGLSEPDQKVKGLGFGADDYLTKPFDKGELIARIQAIVRRSKGYSESIIRTGRIAVNLDTRTVEVNSQPLHLTGKEYGILELLSLRKGTTLTKEMFLNHLYGGMDEPELKIIDVFVCKLRKKLSTATGGDNYIEKDRQIAGLFLSLVSGGRASSEAGASPARGRHGCLSAGRRCPVHAAQSRHRLEIGRYADHALRAAEKKRAVRREDVGHAVQNGAFGVLVKINQDVPAEDDVELAENAIAVEQVEGLIAHHVAQLGRYPPVLALLGEILDQQRNRQAALNLELAVLSLFRLLDNLRRQIGRDDLEFHVAELRGVLPQHHCDGVGFLTAGTGGAPYADPVLSLGLSRFHDWRKNAVAQGVERRLVAEEKRLVRGHRVGNPDGELYIPALLQVADKFVDPRQPQIPRDGRQSALDEIQFVCRDHDTRTRLQEIPQKLEFLRGHIFYLRRSAHTCGAI